MANPDAFREDLHAFKDDIVKRGQRSGPRFSMTPQPLIWHDQVFGRGIEPTGTVNCPQALRVGSTLNSLDVVLVAANENDGPLLIPAGSTITMSFMQGNSEDGAFEAVGPTICIKAPAAGMEVEPDGLVARFPAGNFTKPWLMVSVEFSGAITGGKVDCALSFMPR